MKKQRKYEWEQIKRGLCICGPHKCIYGNICNPCRRKRCKIMERYRKRKRDENRTNL
jgi:hypothetical protein